MAYPNTSYLFTGSIKRLALLAAAGLVLLMIIYIVDVTFDIITYQFIMRDSQSGKYLYIIKAVPIIIPGRVWPLICLHPSLPRTFCKT